MKKKNKSFKELAASAPQSPHYHLQEAILALTEDGNETPLITLFNNLQRDNDKLKLALKIITTDIENSVFTLNRSLQSYVKKTNLLFNEAKADFVQFKLKEREKITKDLTAFDT